MAKMKEYDKGGYIPKDIMEEVFGKKPTAKKKAVKKPAKKK